MKEGQKHMMKLKPGDKTSIKNSDHELLIFAGLDPIFTYNKKPCVFLATDIKNKKTYTRYTLSYLNKHGYTI